MANTRTEAGRFMAGRSYSPATQFKPGQHSAPATEIQPGQRLSPATEFKPGMDAHNRLPVGAVRVRRETHTGRVRAWVKGLSRMYGASGRCWYVRPGTARGARLGYLPPRP